MYEESVTNATDAARDRGEVGDPAEIGARDRAEIGARDRAEIGARDRDEIGDRVEIVARDGG